MLIYLHTRTQAAGDVFGSAMDQRLYARGYRNPELQTKPTLCPRLFFHIFAYANIFTSQGTSAPFAQQMPLLKCNVGFLVPENQGLLSQGICFQ